MLIDFLIKLNINEKSCSDQRDSDLHLSSQFQYYQLFVEGIMIPYSSYDKLLLLKLETF